MKRKPHPLPEPGGAAADNAAASGARPAGRGYWRSLDEPGGPADSPDFNERQRLAREFPEGSSTLEGVDRREFLKLMAASFALGGAGLAAGCRRPEANVLPYGKSVEMVIPGQPLYFATAMPLRRAAIPLIVETHQGRPTKIEGNPSYKPCGGATSALAQASVLDLYDPDRATAHTIDGAAVSTAAIHEKLAAIGKTYAEANGRGLAFLAGESSSPTRAALVRQLREKYPHALWAEYEPVSEEPPQAATAVVLGIYGSNARPVYHFDKARRILSLDADFLHSGPGSLAQARDFAKGRRVLDRHGDMNRLYMAESGFSLTGGMADHRLRLPGSAMTVLAAALLGKISGTVEYDLNAVGFDFKDREKWLSACAADLLSHQGQCLVVAGAHLPVEAHKIAYMLNYLLGNLGKTLDFVDTDAGASPAINLGALASAIKTGAVKTLVILGGNPAYNAPADLDWPALQKSVPEVIRYGYYEDETSAVESKSVTRIAAAHYLESWGDARTADGTIVPVQPMILPLFGGLTGIEVLARILGSDTTDPCTLVHRTITALAPSGADKEKFFRKFLHDGLLEGTAWRPIGGEKEGLYVPPPMPEELSKLVPPALSAQNLEVRFVADSKVDDGRFANNGWLQECPDPMTKIAWGNAILISPRLAKELGVHPAGAALQVARVEEAGFEAGKENAPLAELTLNGRAITGPLHIQPGLADYTVIVPLGYGRTRSGRAGTGTGFNAYPLRTSDAPHFATGGALRLTGARALLANTQEHWSMEGRDLVREANHDEFQKNPSFVAGIGMESHAPPVYGEGNTPADDAKLTPARRAQISAERARQIPRGGSLHATPEFTGEHQWGMVIDLNVCMGCAACVIACQAENNIPIVGRGQVLRGREMHWIRLDRYYSDGRADAGAFGGDGNRSLPEDPQVSLQPVSCQQCELAPCETVCPVNATVHDEEGLNAMAYNRCIGTRYCANNCPYKVRRFNFFDWNKRATDALYLGPLGHQKEMPELLKMVKNPDVTVRMRGVMEKCTYCVQRIQQARIAQKTKARDTGEVKVPDGAITVACQQSCPVGAITFGDISDPRSAVSQARARDQNYSLLGYLNIRPRTTYLGRLRNPNPAMPDYVPLPFSRIEYDNKNHPARGGHDRGAHDEGGGHDAAHAEGGHA
jgi:molybdopterin-containing oxidoreductase family iron-sulfur binding subunit